MTSDHGGGSITSVLQETRVFPPPAEFASKAHIGSMAQYEALWNRAKDDPEGFWGEHARGRGAGTRPGTRCSTGSRRSRGGLSAAQLNASYNCVDRHCAGPAKNKAAIIWEGEPGDRRVLRYQDLLREVSKFANVLKGLGVQKGDVVAVYMPLVPELVIALLACARIGAPHTVIFGGFSAESLSGRIQDCKAKVLVTADGGYRRGKVVPLKENADAAAALCPTLKHMVVYRRTGTHVNWSPGRDHWWHELEANASASCPAEPLDSEHPLYILYTSGSTGKPKGILHTTGGYLVGTTLTTQVGLRPQGRRHLLVHGRRRLGDGPLLSGLRPALQRRHLRHVRGRTQLARRGPVLEDHRGLPGHDPLHRPDGHPRVHEVGRAVPAAARPVEPAAAGHGRRADQPRGLDVVSQGHRRRSMPDRRHLVADRNRRDHDLAAAGRDPDGPGSATRPLPGIVPEIVTKDGQPVPGESRRLSRDQAALAVDAAHALRRRRALQGAVLERHPRLLLHRRRRPPRRERQLLDHGPRRRRAQRRRPPALDHGGRERPGQPSRPWPRRPSWASPTT